MILSAKKPLVLGATVAAALALAALPALAESSLGETYEGSHLAAGPNKPYVVNPPLSDATIEKRKAGYFRAIYGGDWTKPSAEEIAAMERRRAGQSAERWSNQ